MGDFFDILTSITRGAVHCPTGGVCNASSSCANTSHTEIENNDNNLQFNSGSS